MKPLFKSLKFKLTIWHAFILTILLTLFSFLMFTEFSRVLYRDVDKTLTQEVYTIKKAFMRDLKAHGESLETLAADPSLASKIQLEEFSRAVKRTTLMVRIIDQRYNEIFSNLKGWEADIIFPDYQRDAKLMETGKSHQTIHFERKPVRLFYSAVSFKRQPLLIIQSGASLHEMKGILERLLFSILIFIPGAVLAAFLAGWFLAKRSLSPIDSMIGQARKITAAYLNKRLPRTQAGDELDRLAETLNEMIDRIDRSTQSVHDFSSNVSHELKTPLAIIRGEIDVTLRKERSSEHLVRTLNVIGGEVDELIRLVNDLMILVRSDSKQLHFLKEEIFLGDAVSQVFARFERMAKEKEIRFVFDMKADSKIKGDPVYLKRLFSNLIDNAFKFTSPGGQVSVTLKHEVSQGVVEVRDSGIGIATEDLEKIFARFFRSDQARAEEGVGLGLNIAKVIAESHGGKIMISSEVGVGTTVIIRLPATLV